MIWSPRSLYYPHSLRAQGVDTLRRYTTIFYTLITDTTPVWCLIPCILTLIWSISKLVIGRSSMDQQRKLCHLTRHHLSGKRWIYDSKLIRITPETKPRDDLVLAILYLSTALQSSGSPRGNPRLRPQSLAPSLWPWKTAWKRCADYAIIYGWWAYLCLDHSLLMATTCLW